ncbi:MAG: catalase [bacterium]|nr:catalase [bacterium]
MAENKKPLTTSQGAPVPDDLNSMTAGERGPVLAQDIHLFDKLAHFDRERIPERVVHAKGAGAGGYFEVTHNVTKYTRANFLSQIGKKTEVFARFSTVGGEKGSADTDRDPRGFAVKFFTEEGNYDFVGNNTPVFFIRDPLKFPDFIHTQKRNPATNLKDADMFWDFLSLTPESVHQVTILFSDRGTPNGYRHMHGFSGHTFMWYNEKNEYVWVKIHFRAELGSKTFTREEAGKLAGEDPDFATRDLHNAIEKGEFPEWRVYVQIMTPEQVEKYRFNSFDITKVWPHADAPLIPVGRMVLNRNPKNYFAETEQAAFSPGTVVPGIAPSPDKMLQGRLFSYHDTHRHRLGTNYHLIPINAPHVSGEHNYQRDGAMRTDENGVGSPNYSPNSFGGPLQEQKYSQPPVPLTGVIDRFSFELTDDDFVQPAALYRKVMSDTDRTHLIGNIVGHLKNAQPRIQKRQTALFYKVDKEYGERVAQGLGLIVEDIAKLAALTQAERVKATS